ncbi:hypothetical protein PROFUN_07554 [Planoprotostelium fungivorum]|uniref:Importin N-terminal domain-containing protein n=1 Tax=Planoprotostelium fungivorum TaxID=1890364 RepID=A0A2P6NLR2_9EUKA|nr:hypothetical protein PROFUN_07554 [Planoprotostelium fungivorum]
MDVQQVIYLLSCGLSSNNQERTSSEKALSALQNQPNYCVALLQIAGNNEVPEQYRQIAAIMFKRHTQSHWIAEQDDEARGEITEVGESYTNDADRTWVRTHIVDALTYTPSRVQSQLGVGFKNIARLEWPNAWPELLPQILNNLVSKDALKTHGALLAVRLLARNYQYIPQVKRRIPLENLVNTTFPIVLQLLQSLSQLQTEAAGHMILLILKCFWSSSNFGMPTHLAGESVMVQWMTEMLKLLEAPIPPGEPADEDMRKDFVWWKCKRWVVKIFDRLFNRYGETKQLPTKDGRDFSRQFLKLYAPRLLETSMRILFSMKNGNYLPSRIQYSCLSFVNHAVRNQVMYPMLKPHVDALFKEVLFPLVCFSNADMELWNDDPEEYLRKEFDIEEDFYSPKSAASLIIIDLGRNRGKNHLNPMMSFVGMSMMRYLQATEKERNPQEKDGCMAVIGELEDKLRITPSYQSQLENLIIQHIYPEFTSPHPWLRAKACWIFGKYYKMEWSNSDNFKTGLRQVLTCIRDPELPVRVRAVMALQFLIQNPVSTEEIRNILPQLLEEIFKIMGEIDNDELVVTLRTIIDHFSEEMGPYSLGLCQKLSQIFIKICNENNDEDDSAITALECLGAIQTILEAISGRPELYPPIEEVLYPLLQVTLQPDLADFFEEGVKIITFITYFSNEISPRMWSLFPVLHDRFQECSDFIQDILNPLDNYISRSTETFLTAGPYLPMVSEMYKKLILNTDESESNCLDACKLIEAVILNCRGRVDQFIEPYCQIALARLVKAKKDNLRCLLIGIVVNSIYYNPAFTLDIMNRNNWTQQFFTVWFQHIPKLPRTHDKKLTILTLLSLMTMTENIPEVVRVASIQMLETAILTCHDLLRHKQIIAEAEEEDDDFEDNDPTDQELDDTQPIQDEEPTGVQELTGEDDDFDDWDDDEFEEDEEVTTPLDNFDETAMLLEFVKRVQRENFALYDSVLKKNGAVITRLNELEARKCVCEAHKIET